MTAQLIMLNVLDDKLQYSPERKTLSILLSATRLTVAQMWKKPKAPALTIWYSKLWTFYKIARITDCIIFHTSEEEVQ